MPDPSTIEAFVEARHVDLCRRFTGFVQQEVAALQAPSSDQEGREQARLLMRRLGEGGWVGEGLGTGSQGAVKADSVDLRACCLMRESLASASPLADEVFALQCLGSMPLILAGDPAHRSLVRGAVEGRLMAAFAMTEPEAGSDVASLQTRAHRDGDSYRLQGGKHLISNAGIADFYVVFASTDPEQGRRGISAFVVEADNPGLRYVGAQVLSAPHPLGEIAFEDCKVTTTARLGAEGEGFRLGMSTLDRLRPTVAAAACGMAERALAEAQNHVHARHQFGRPLSEQQLVQQKLARMATELTASRLLVYRAAAVADRGQARITMEAAMAKLYATEAAQRVVDDAVQLLGGRGVLAEHPVDLLYRSVRALRIYEGTSEIQHLVIARELTRVQA